MLDTTDRAFRLVVSDSPLAGLLRTQVLARIAAFAVNRRWVQKIAFRTVSQTGIHYRRSPLSVVADALPKQAPQAGANVPRSAFFLLRPDGHVGLCGRTVDAAAVRRYFAENLAVLDGERHRRIAGGNRPTAPVASVVEGGAC